MAGNDFDEDRLVSRILTSVDERFKEREKRSEKWETNIESAISELLNSQRELNISATKQQEIAIRIEENGMKQIDALKSQCADIQSTMLSSIDRIAKSEAQISVLNALLNERNETNRDFRKDTNTKLDKILGYLTPLAVIGIAIGLAAKQFF